MSSNWERDWHAFSDSESLSPPAAVTGKIFSVVHADLRPNPWKVFSKLALIHALTGTFTLSLCPQFGFRTFGQGMGLMGTFMSLGSYGCMVACGSFFLGTSLLFAALILRPEELRVIRNDRLLELAALTLLSLGGFIMADAEVVWGFAAAWALGSILGGTVMLELGWSFRTHLTVRA